MPWLYFWCPLLTPNYQFSRFSQAWNVCLANTRGFGDPAEVPCCPTMNMHMACRPQG